MPGITGIISKAGGLGLDHQVSQMVSSMMHEPFYSSGTVSIPESSAAIGWVAHEQSFSDCMPLWNPAKSICLVITGECFPDDRTASHFIDWKSARCLLPFYEQLGPEFFASLNGNFSGVVIDLREGSPTITLFNDRFGLSRLYFYEDESGFFFASEAKALLAILPSLRRIDSVGLAEFFSTGCVSQNRTLFQGVHLLPPASRWTWQAGESVSRTSYFDPRLWIKQEPLSPEQFYEALAELFPRVATRYFSSSQRVAMSITGGLDSRMIMAAVRPAPGTLDCYSFGGPYRDCMDVRIGRAVAQACQQSHQTLPLTTSFFEEFPDLASQAVYLSDGTMDVSGAAAIFANRLARQVAPIRMTGNYGGEILRSIRGLKAGPLDETLFVPDLVALADKSKQRIEMAVRENLRAFIAFQQVPWAHHAMYSIERALLTVRSPYLDNDLVALSFRAPSESHLNKNMAFRYIAEADSRLAGIPNDRGAVWQPGTDLGRRRSRLRWLKEEFFPRAEYMFDYGMPHWLARANNLLSPLNMDRFFLGHQKFYHFRRWYRQELSGYVREVLLDERTLQRPYWQRKTIESIVESHTRGTANHTTRIHKLLSCELLHRNLLERN